MNSPAPGSPRESPDRAAAPAAPPSPVRAGGQAAPVSPADVAATLGLGADRGRPIWRRPWAWGSAAAGLIIISIYLYAHRAPPPVEYTMAAARRGDLAVTVVATGTLAPLDTVIVGTQVSGLVDSVLVDYNDPVRAGQPLAIINTDLLRAQIDQSRAALLAAQASRLQTQATLVQARKQFAISDSLFRQAVLAQQDIDTATADLARAVAGDSNAQAGIGVATAALHAQLTTLGQATIRAPINGIVLERSVEPGATVAATLQSPVLFVLAADLKRMTVTLDVDEADIGQVKAGQTANFTVDAYPDRTFIGTVRTVYNAAIMVEGVVTYEAILDVNNSDLALRPGMTATASVNTATVTNALLVPNAALRFVPAEAPATATGQAPATTTGHQVWTIRNGQLAPITIQVGLTDGLWTQVTGGAVEVATSLVTGIAEKAATGPAAAAHGDTGSSTPPGGAPRGR